MKKDILIYFDLITCLKTTQELACFLAEIDTLMQTFFKSEKVSMEKALRSISENSAQKIRQVFAENHLDINDKDVVAGFFDTLKSLLQKLKVIKLVLAFDPSCQTIENLHNFVKSNLGIGYIFDIEISEDILGGAIVISNGNYYDFSLKKRIQSAFETKKEEILMLLQK